MLEKLSGGIAWYTVTFSLCRSKKRSHKQNDRKIED